MMGRSDDERDELIASLSKKRPTFDDIRVKLF